MDKAFEKILEKMEEKLRKSEKRYYRYLDDSNLSCMFDRSDIEEKRVDTIKEMLEIVKEVAEEHKITNGDKIRSMSDEELADWLEDVTDDVFNGSRWNKDGWIEWLQSEAE